MKNKKLRSKSITGKKMTGKKMAGKKVKAKLQPGGAKSATSLKMKRTSKPALAMKSSKRLKSLTGRSARRLNSTQPKAAEAAPPIPTPVSVIDAPTIGAPMIGAPMSDASGKGTKRKRTPGGDSDRGFYLRLGDERKGPINKALVKAAADRAKMSMNAYAAAAVMHMVKNGLPPVPAEGMDPGITSGDIEGEEAGLDKIAQPA